MRYDRNPEDHTARNLRVVSFVLGIVGIAALNLSLFVLWSWWGLIGGMGLCLYLSSLFWGNHLDRGLVLSSLEKSFRQEFDEAKNPPYSRAG